MSRPRFLTAIAAAAAVCDGMEETIAANGVTPAYLVFEWLLVEGFARAADRADVHGTPGIGKASACRQAETPMCARAYLKAPTVFGYHGVYRRLARDTGILDNNGLLCENGYALLKIWEKEQGLIGFLDSASAGPGASAHRQMLRDAVADSLKAGFGKRKGGWAGWQFFALHLTPARVGGREAEFLRGLLLDPKGETRGELFRLMEQPENLAAADLHDAAQAHHLLPQASPEPARRLRVIMAYENFGTLLERAFDWLRWLSSQAGAQSLPPAEFAARPEVQTIAAAVPGRLQTAERALDEAPPQAQCEFAKLAPDFTAAVDAKTLYETLLHRHAEVEAARPPDGKRSWFERAADGGAMVRPPYRLDEPPRTDDGWGRPYRLGTVASFCRDLRRE